MPQPSYAVEITAIDKAVQALQDLKDILQASPPVFRGFHDNPIDGVTFIRRSNQQSLDDGTETMVQFTENPTSDPDVRAHCVLIQFPPI